MKTLKTLLENAHSGSFVKSFVVNRRAQSVSHSHHKVNNKISSPDTIYYNKSKTYSFFDDSARPFIYNLKTNTILWGEKARTHNDIIFDLTADEQLKYGYDDISYVSELLETELEQDNKCGRIWVIPNNKSVNRKFDVYIAWWNELSRTKLLSYSRTIVEEYNKQFKNTLNSYMVVNINGEFMLIDPNENVIKIERDDEKRKADIEALRAIHLANQKEKQMYFKKFRSQRNDKLQKKLWNTTKSKTAAEYNHIKTIGDSLEINIINNNMKSLLEYIMEEQSISFPGKQSNQRYGQCVILAGGPGSGKGFIQNKILGDFRVYDVDKMKKDYLKLVKLGKIKDDTKYDWTNPDDVSKLHKAVKKHGWKNTQRKLFWDQRQNKEEHSSGLLPNILFDMVSGSIEDLFEVIIPAYVMGYKITIVWVVCNKEVAEIGNEIRDRRVGKEVIDTGHAEAYDTMKTLFTNQCKELTEVIDAAWVGFSAGYCRQLTDKYAKSPVIKIKASAEEDFKLNFGEIDSFLKNKMPINNAAVQKQLNSSDNEKVEQAKKWISIVGDEYKGSVKESYDFYEDELIEKWQEALSEIL